MIAKLSSISPNCDSARYTMAVWAEENRSMFCQEAEVNGGERGRVQLLFSLQKTTSVAFSFRLNLKLIYIKKYRLWFKILFILK